ncbi:MAG: NADH-quinone oxidoreductase subunit J [Thermoguttaceae bacterium]|jgi:NADH-quinone oxidoreductase subunit J
MSDPRQIIALAAAAAAAGLWLLLPRGAARGRSAGALLALAALAAWAWHLPGLADRLAGSLFWVVAGVTIVAAAATVTFRSPVYCAIWFGMTLVGTAGLFLLAGAQFLAVATLVVYAGAILVTFLFVLMLCQPEGHTSYDRRSWEALLSAATGAVMIGILSMTLAGVLREGPAVSDQRSAISGRQSAVSPSPLATSHYPPATTPSPVARLGAELFTRYLIAIEVTGTLLFAALVGAAVIVTQGKTRPPEPGSGE